MVVELLHVTHLRGQPPHQFNFHHPRDGWVFTAAAAELKPGERVQIAFDADAPSEDGIRLIESGKVVERMQYLPAGEHTLTLWFTGKPTLSSLVIRSVPEMVFCKFGVKPHVAHFGPYDGNFLERSVLPNVNTIVGDGDAQWQPQINAWQLSGGKWFTETSVPSASDHKSALSSPPAQLREMLGRRSHEVDGVFADEFGGASDVFYTAWAGAIRQIASEPGFKPRSFYAYCHGGFDSLAGREFIQSLLQSGSRIVWERYLPEPATERGARQILNVALSQRIANWQTNFPGCQEKMVVALGYFSAPPSSLNGDPQVDFKVWMDLQFQHLATAPAFNGLCGLMEYTASYADEETVRWAGRLFRHYGIEGHTELLSPKYGFRYRLRHLVNSDFTDNLNEWRVLAAEPGSIAHKRMEGLGWLEGRYPRSTQGDDYLWMKRNPRAPNQVAQRIKHLKSGQCYSLKMISADLGDLRAGRSRSVKHEIEIALSGVEMLPNNSLQEAIPSSYDVELGPFNQNHRAWFNYHQRVFRAKGKSVELIISQPVQRGLSGSEENQELAVNFIEVQPYFTE